MKLTKRRIALIQLEQSVKLLSEGDAVSALTLAGAAEEILGRAAARKGHRPRVEVLAAWVGSLCDYLKKPRPSVKELVRDQNQPRNHLKHQDDGRSIYVDYNWRFEAEEMILRAMYNYHDAYGSFPSSRLLRDWFEGITE